MKTRVLVPELMDDPELERQDHFSALQGLGRINRWTRNAALAWQPVADLARQHSGVPLRVLDVATGGADIPLQILRLARRAGLELEVDACDFSSHALAFGAQRCEQAGAKVRLMQLDILNQEIEDRYDLVMCSQFLHHLTDQQAVVVLGKMARAARHRVVAVDLLRSRWNWLQVWLATRILSRSKIVHFDGPQSIRAAYTLPEMETIAGQIGFECFRITTHWPCRFVLVGDLHDDS